MGRRRSGLDRESGFDRETVADYQRMAAEAASGMAAHAARAIREGLPPEEGIPSYFEALLQMMGDLPERAARRIRRFVEGGLGPDLLDPDTLRGLLMLLAMGASGTFTRLADRAAGDYAVDEFGMDPGYVERVKPFLRFMYRKWWRVETSGLHNVPDTGRALLVANHSGTLAWDGAMIATSIFDEHPSGRLARALHLEWFVRTPFAAPFLQRTGQVLANPENGERLLSRDHLVTVFPEGAKGAGKLYRQRYRLARFGRGGFVRMAVRTGCPIVPVSVVGAEEIHPLLLKIDPLARILGLPYFPITPTFPWLGPFGVIPLPSRWRIHFDEPIPVEAHPEDADDFHVVSQISDEVRSIIQERVLELREERGRPFF